MRRNCDYNILFEERGTKIFEGRTKEAACSTGVERMFERSELRPEKIFRTERIRNN